MCSSDFSKLEGVSRRTVLGAAAVAAAGLGVGLPGAASAAAEPSVASSPKQRTRTHVVLLGAGGGPRLDADSDLAGPSSALVVGDRYYVVDAGEGVLRQLTRARLGAAAVDGRNALTGLRAVFVTHQHSDHVVDLANLFSLGLFNGLTRADRPVQLIGPGDRGVLPPVYGDAAPPPVVAPERPTPGVAAMFDALVATYATDFNDRARDNRQPVPAQLVEARDILLPEHLTADPNGNPHPEMEPVTVYADDRVEVTATLVQHAPVFPAFAYRFDTEDGSVVFSGDTSPSRNLIRLARGADVLVHEVISRQAMEALYPEPRSPESEATLQHILSAHTTIEEVGPLADEAGVRTLVLNHLAPSDLPTHLWRRAGDHFSGETIVGTDLLVVNVG